jgi:hypothetical protein
MSLKNEKTFRMKRFCSSKKNNKEKSKQWWRRTKVVLWT